MSQPYFQIKDQFQKLGVHVFSSNYPLYADMSKRVMQTLSEFTPDLEIYSIDEAFLSLKGFENRNLQDYATQIKKTVYQYTGIPVSIGIAPTKVLAKAANHIAKKNKKATAGVFSMMDENIRNSSLKKMSTKDIWGIGSRSHQKLQEHRIFTAFDLMTANPYLIQKNLSIVGRRIQEELQGISCLQLQQIQAAQKQIISSRSFDQYVTSLERLQESVALHISEAAIKLRQQNLAAGSLTVFIQTNPHSRVHTQQYFNSASVQMLTRTSHTGKLIHFALQALNQIFKKDYHYKKAGIMLNDLQPKSGSQMDFFQQYDTSADDLEMQTLDKINRQHGKHTLKYAVLGTDPQWEIKFRLKSPCYTTRWSELLKI
jgi:DNA polymerase V